jgi:hypothetical protein
VSTHGVPDDVCFTLADFGADTEHGATIWCPGHLKHPFAALDPFDPEASPNTRDAVAISEVRNHLLYGSAESALLLRSEVPVAVPELGRLFVGRHPRRLLLVERVQEIAVSVVPDAFSSVDLCD